MDPQTPAGIQQAPITAPVETVPSTWPGAFGLYKYSRNAVSRNLWTIIGLFVINIVGSGILTSLFSPKTSKGYDLGDLLSGLFGVLISIATTVVLIASVRSTEISIGESFRKSLSLYFKALVLSVLSGLIAVASAVLFIVPFFFIMPRLALAQYFLVDKNLGPIEALKASWEATRGNVGKVWGIFGATIAMAVLIIVLVGIYFLLMYSAAMALLYVYLLAKAQASAAPNDTVASPDSNTPAAPIV